MNNKNSSFLVLLATFLMILNIYQIHASSEKNKEIKKISTDYEKLSSIYNINKNSLDEFQFLWKLFYEDIEFRIPENPKSELQLISIFPENTCWSCIFHDSKILSDLVVDHQDKIHVYVLTTDSIFSKKQYFPENFNYNTINHLNEILVSQEDLSYKLNAPLHLLINNKSKILSFHLTSMYFPENSNVFFRKIGSII